MKLDSDIVKTLAIEHTKVDVDALVVLSNILDFGLLKDLSELQLPVVIDLDSGKCTIDKPSVISRIIISRVRRIRSRAPSFAKIV